MILAAAALAAPLVGEHGPVGTFDPAARFVPGDVAFAAQNDPSAVAADTLRYLREAPGDPMLAPGALAELGVTRADIEATLALVAAGRLDPGCFRALRWVPDRPTFRLTRYLVWEVEGRAARDETHPVALYALPDDEAELAAPDAEARRDTLLRYRYTRAQVRGGVYLPGGEAAGRARPLVWLSIGDHEEAMLQGTVSVRIPGEPTPRLYNVHRNNGRAWNRGQGAEQTRQWYFREVDAVRGHGVEPTPGIALAPLSAVAGDVGNVGAGTVLALRAADGWRVVVLADTGGAFRPNLHQLDLYVGPYASRAAFDAATGRVGDTAEVWVLVARRPEDPARACPGG